MAKVYYTTGRVKTASCVLTSARLVPNKYFKEPRRAKPEKLGAQQVMCREPLQKN